MTYTLFSLGRFSEESEVCVLLCFQLVSFHFLSFLFCFVLFCIVLVLVFMSVCLSVCFVCLSVFVISYKHADEIVYVTEYAILITSDLCLSHSMEQGCVVTYDYWEGRREMILSFC